MTHKIIINKCYGGPSLSNDAYEWLRDNKGIPIKEYDIPIGGEKYYFESKDLLFWEDTWRFNSDVIECIETLGSEIASGYCAKLVIEEFEGDLYNINEYDGFEELETPETKVWKHV